MLKVADTRVKKHRHGKSLPVNVPATRCGDLKSTSDAEIHRVARRQKDCGEKKCAHGT